MKACVLTLGCKVNLYESEVIKEDFINKNYEIVNIDQNPDVIIINTCSVTNQSDSKSRKLIRQSKRLNPKSTIVVCGCFSEHHKEDILELGVDVLIGNKDKTKLGEYVNKYLETKNPVVRFYDLTKEPFEDMFIENFEGKTRGFVKIQDGCNNFCSFCIIPYMRGRLKNKDINVAYEEIKKLTTKGFKEIVLTGIHTGSYGKEEGYTLVDLIKKISKLDNLKRIRISSIEITEIDDEFLKELKANNKICDHLHIPLQTGNDKVLKEMNRKYTIQEFINKVNEIRKVRPDINLTTDVIVGFPTETKEDFNETIKNIKIINFSKIHVFPYSKRDGTAASKMKNIVSDYEKKERAKILLDLSNELEKLYYEKFLGKNAQILVEDKNTGYTSNYIRCKSKKELKHNEFYTGKILSIDKEYVNIS